MRLIDCPSRSFCSTSCRASGVSTGGAPDALPLSPGPDLSLDAALPDVAPLPLGDGQGEVQQELAGGGGGVELPLREDHQVDAGVVASLMKRRPSTARRLMRSMR